MLDNENNYVSTEQLIEDIEFTTGKDYNYYDRDITSVYLDALIDVYNMLITFKINLNDMLKETDKYKLDKKSREFIQELVNYNLKK